MSSCALDYWSRWALSLGHPNCSLPWKSKVLLGKPGLCSAQEHSLPLPLSLFLKKEPFQLINNCQLMTKIRILVNMSAKLWPIQTFCFVNINNALTTEQFGLHPSHSAVSALFNFTKDIYSYKQCLGVLLGFFVYLLVLGIFLFHWIKLKESQEACRFIRSWLSIHPSFLVPFTWENLKQVQCQMLPIYKPTFPMRFDQV